MIIVYLQGGLGNQLFQYAAARRLAFTLGVPLKLDTGFYATQSLRAYELDKLCIDATMATARESARWRGPRLLTRITRLRARITRTLGIVPRLVIERNFRFDPSILQLSDGRYLEGYWQSYRYFQDVGPMIRRECAVRTPPSDADRRLLDRMSRGDSICVHVRRGDYVTNPAAQQYHGLCSPDYYRRAVGELAARVGAPELFVFSDDMPWVKQHLEFGLPTTHVDLYGPGDAPLELRLMAGCRHFVLANSSLSWWAAWLSSQADGIVYAPRQWFADPAIDTSDLTPPDWQRI